MTTEEIRRQLGLKSREEFLRENVLPRIHGQPELSLIDALTVGTGKTTEMLLAAAAYALRPQRKPFVIVASRREHAFALHAQLRDMLERLGYPEAICDIEYGTAPRAGYEHFIDHQWNLVQEPK